MRPDPYPAISRGPRGSFEWAMDQLRAGNEVRREHWPIEVTPLPVASDVLQRPCYRTMVWHLYEIGTHEGICKGFNSGVVGADNDAWGDLGVDSQGWTPTTDDLVALDWQTVAEVTPEQITFLDANRMKRWPNEAVADYRRASSGSNRGMVVLIIILAAIVGTLWWATSTGRIP